MLAHFVEVCKEYHALKDRLYGWLSPTKPYEVLADVEAVERVARLAKEGVSYCTDANGVVWVECDVAGVRFCAMRDRGRK